MADIKKFLDEEGLKLLWSKVNMGDYPNNETLIAILNAIDTTKQDSLTGTNGQVVGFDENGNAIAIDLNLSNTQSAFIVHAYEYTDGAQHPTIQCPYLATENVEDAFNAISNGNLVILEINNGGFPDLYPCVSYAENDYLNFSLINNYNGEITLDSFTWFLEEGQYIAKNDPISLSDTTSVEENYLSISGGSMEGSLILAQDPTEDLEAVTKQYVDNLIGDINSILQSI